MTVARIWNSNANGMGDEGDQYYNGCREYVVCIPQVFTATTRDFDGTRNKKLETRRVTPE
jgi:hypothetical protein